ncbi:hypothetical protein BJF85_06705 [Saccharomonospora sp. CUA-673]|uniref:hypothetical protein n=1 Tax=Saccharomonospora sp. CUA-673 TaxID=1904969 RepID=UPI000965ACC5|nr:hypothetical protein [Saccharomonospora sp. CUA-673]OLT40020.1 hypothetical protein BJF85_06705 [Saccharomonospora sp. CUA-673]
MTAESEAAIAAENARIGAMLSDRGLTPDQIFRIMRDQVHPAMQEALAAVEAGADVDDIVFEIRRRDGHE